MKLLRLMYANDTILITENMDMLGVNAAKTKPIVVGRKD